MSPSPARPRTTARNCRNRAAAAVTPSAWLAAAIELLAAIEAKPAAPAAVAGEGIAAEETPFCPWGLRAAGRAIVIPTTAFRSGRVEIQDKGSQIVAFLSDARPGMRVADFCAGTGGKTLALAMANSTRLAALDSSPNRLDRAICRLRRAGVHNGAQC